MPTQKKTIDPKLTDRSLDEAHTPAELVKHRKAIDALDNQIIALLKERAGIVQNVGKLKRDQGTRGCFIRAGREADMLRRIWNVFSDGVFSPVAAAQIWRIIIGASTNLESDLRISVCAPDNDPTLFWLAREYFGTFVSVQRHPNVNRVIGDVVDGKAEVGILPALGDETHGNWWLTLAGQRENPPRIFAHVPFIVSDHERGRHSSYAIARVTPEATHDDVTLMVANAGDISIHRLTSAFAAVGLTAARVQFSEPQPDGTLFHLLKVDGFVTADDPRLATLSEKLADSVISWQVLGSYAAPITTNETC